ncbi:hypothetical protein KUCAC02_026068 [Chaenocephalus aceratus]|uniref:Uncharacterized protein n=1 Tax=Chaenocephalus aceratus TaxID=36190 RepID=A0ACB9VVN4_CHAAC|nr:hypothetical protein KUCAC02_026068 [Chaenocephalus aceratus]
MTVFGQQRALSLMGSWSVLSSPVSGSRGEASHEQMASLQCGAADFQPSTAARTVGSRWLLVFHQGLVSAAVGDSSRSNVSTPTLEGHIMDMGITPSDISSTASSA